MSLDNNQLQQLNHHGQKMPYNLKSGEFNPPKTAANIHLRNANGHHNYLSQGNNMGSGEAEVHSNGGKRPIYE